MSSSPTHTITSATTSTNDEHSASSAASSTDSAAQELLEKLRYLEKIDPEGKLEITQRMSTIVEKGLKKMVEASGKYLHGDSAKKEEPSKVKNLLDAIPESLNVKNVEGELPPLRMAFLAGIKWSTKLQKVISERSNDLKEIDDVCGLYPFQQAVVGNCELNVIYDLIRRFPGCLAAKPEEEKVDLHETILEEKVKELSIEQMKSNIEKRINAPPPTEPGTMSKEDLAKSKKICYYLLKSEYGKKTKILSPKPKKNKRKLNEGKIEWNR
mmetsp:Transcript_22599/g.33461  ORF Transcript_22599/g.33461 Transcript_22599/m.33461 type:complete len:269 (+) Transcript_22599:112-918(+)